ncbi:MAG TPA: NAD-binding protein [Solirubrobacteraceae bacterium]|nr:NAD-binding protein [Solirubrobacteraceae bacterium]
MRVIVVGAGAVGRTAVESLHEHHDCTVLDLDPARLKEVSDALDVRVVRGDGAGREALQAADVKRADLVLACMPRAEANLVAAMLVRRLSDAQTVIRTGDTAYLDTWRSGDLDVDFIVSTEFQTASAVARLVGVPGAAASCLGNVGPAFGSAGPFGSYAEFTDLSKVMLSVLMLLGRVEIVPIAVLFTRSFSAALTGIGSPTTTAHHPRPRRRHSRRMGRNPHSRAVIAPPCCVIEPAVALPPVVHGHRGALSRQSTHEPGVAHARHPPGAAAVRSRTTERSPWSGCSPGTAGLHR